MSFPWTNTYGYDSARRLSSVVSPAGTFGYQFNGAGGLVTKLTQPSGFWITNTFDSRARLIDTTLYDNTSAILNRHGYALNHAHQRTTVTRTNYASTTYNRKVDYTYDNAGEVRTARAYDGSGAAVAAENFDYGYDAGWNLLKRTNNVTVTSYSLNNLNQITADGGASWSHDSNGNLTYHPTGGTGDLSYTYDDENQLLSVISSSAYKHEFTYDGRGRVRVRKDYYWSGGNWYLNTDRRYVYDGMLVVQERNASQVPLVSYTRGVDLSGSLAGAGGIGGLLARSTHATTSPYAVNSSAYYHADGNGNVTYLVRSDGGAYASYRYDPYGRTLSSAGTLAYANAMRFSSKPVVLVNGTMWGSYYYGYRFYDPLTQRWINRDPILEEGGINLYGFVGNHSINMVDPLGLESRYIKPWIGSNPFILSDSWWDQLYWGPYNAGAAIFNQLEAAEQFAGYLGDKLLGPHGGEGAMLYLGMKCPCPRPRYRPNSPILPPRVLMDKQGHHILGSKTYIPGRSPFTHKNPQGLIDRFAGRGQPANNIPRGNPGFRERVDFGETIGEVGGQPTSKGLIHYAENGCHIVPSKP